MRFVRFTLAKFNQPICVNITEVISYTAPVENSNKGDAKCLLVMKNDDLIGLVESFEDVDRQIRLAVN